MKEKEGVINNFLKSIHPYTHEKIEKEIKEHFTILSFFAKKVIIPLICVYIIFGLIFNLYLFDSLFLALVVFIYSSLLPDTDIFFKITNKKMQESIWYEKLGLLFFAPLVVFYMLVGRAKKMYTIKQRPFHNFSIVFVYGFFLLIVSSIFWSTPLEKISLPILGMLGYAIHVLIDKFPEKVKFIKMKKKGHTGFFS